VSIEAASQQHNRIANLPKKLILIASFLAAGFLLGRIQLLLAISPFGPAFVAACFLATRFGVRVREPAELRERVELLATSLTT
jgi:hypothetical protein